MLLAVFLLAIILILPIFITVYGCYCIADKRLYFAIYIFGVFKLISGYVKTRREGGFYIHLPYNKAIIIDFETIKKLSGGPDYFKYVSILNFYIVVDIGVKNLNLLFGVYSTMSAIKNYSKILQGNGKTTKIVADLNVYNSSENLKYIKFKSVFILNLVCILQSIIANANKVGAKYVKRKTKKLKRIFS